MTIEHENCPHGPGACPLCSIRRDEAELATLRAALAEVTRRLESAPPWPSDDVAMDDEQLRALQQRWATGPERYQADADALIATTRKARAALAKAEANATRGWEHAKAQRERADVAEAERDDARASYALECAAHVSTARDRDEARAERDEARRENERLRAALIALANELGPEGVTGDRLLTEIERRLTSGVVNALFRCVDLGRELAKRGQP